MYICNKCKIEMKKGIYIKPTMQTGISDFISVSDKEAKSNISTMFYSGPGEIKECFKCPKCGHSILVTSNNNQNKQLIHNQIALAGLACAGKSEIYKYLAKIIYPPIQLKKFAKPLYDINDALGVSKHRTFMQEESDLCKKHFGDDIFVKILINSTNYIGCYVIDDLRYKIEFDALIKHDWYIVYVEADEKLRKERSDKLGLKWSPNHKSEQEIDLFKNKCHCKITNNGTLENLYKQIEEKLIN